MNHRRTLLASCVFLMLLGAAATAQLPDGSPLPWALRDHFTITTDYGHIIYAVENTEWELHPKDGGPIITKAASSITFGDGKVTDLMQLVLGDPKREPFDGPYGPGTRYVLDFPAQGGVQISHSMALYKTKPFLTIQVVVTNTGTEPFEIARISPVVLNVQGISNLSGNVKSASRRGSARGTFYVPDPGLPPMLTVFSDPDKKISLSLGTLPTGMAEPTATLAHHEGRWLGEIGSVYSPPKRVMPGQTVASDPVWLSYQVPSIADINTYYTWAIAMLDRPAATGYPDAWVTVANGATPQELYAAASAWGSVIKHALVPTGWDVTPGWPQDISRVAADLKQQGFKPGITIDPLSTRRSRGGAVADAAGLNWLNPAEAEGQRQGAANVAELASGGFEFFVIEPSPIPDEVLQQFGLTRKDADELAFKIAAEGAGTRPVLPTSSGSIEPTLEAWLDASAATSGIRMYGGIAGPARLDASKASALDDATLAAMMLYGGPIEYYGKPSGGLARQLEAVHPRATILGKPIDFASPGPKVWHVVSDFGSATQRAVIVEFPGAAPWTPADLGASNPATSTVIKAQSSELRGLGTTATPTKAKR